MTRQLAMLQDAMVSSRALRLCYYGLLGIVGAAAVIVAVTPALVTTW